jgi:two-component system CheB/CheR fusion protein
MRNGRESGRRTKQERAPAATGGSSPGRGRRSVAAAGTGAAPLAFPIVGVGASAGGLDAFTQLLTHVPADSGMAFVFIQHLDPNHASRLREALARVTKMKVSDVDSGVLVRPDEVYVMPPDADLSIEAGRLILQPRRRQDRRPHLPIDAFFRALAVDRGSRAIGVVLSGTASDGTEGLRAIKAESGITFAQDPRSAKFGGMPQSAVEAGVVDHCSTIPRLADELLRLGRHPYLARAAVWPASDEGAFKQILGLIDRAVGVDLAEYKRPTVERRLSRRMALRGLENVTAYLALLERDPAEVRALYEDILIHVTSLFRDPEAFESLRTLVFPAILARKGEGMPVRVWVAGCSTGEEVYSLAICLLEYLQDTAQTRTIQIFGSDVSERAVDKARAGIYPDAALRDLSDERRRSYFTKVDGGHRVNKAVRDLCVFVRHNLARDPPFSKLDLVSCRNVLIYFDQALQKRVLPTLHYCLRPGGFLLLGRTENISGFGRLFVPVDRARKIFARTAVASPLQFAPRSELHPTAAARLDRAVAVQPKRSADVARHIDRLLLGRYAPPGVVVNERLEILQFRGRTGSFLQPAPGEPQTNVVKMARDGLLAALTVTIAKAKKTLAPVRKEGVEVDQDGFVRRCNLVVLPVSGIPEAEERLYVVLFEPASAAGEKTKRGAGATGRGKRLPVDRPSSRLEHELAATREYVQSLIEEHGRSNDEVAAANAELISNNEELQSMNEELETAKEELQSTNEELTTVNDELHSRNQEMNVVNNDLINLLGTVDIPILILDPERRIRRFTPQARSILNVLPTDVGRSIGDIKLNIEVPDLARQIDQVVEQSAMKESEVQDGEGRWYRMQIRPYRATDDRIDGTILSLVDIDALKHHVSEAQQARAEAEQANRAKDQFLATLSHELRTPLSAMLIHAQRLSRDDLAAEQVKASGQAVERGTRLQVQLIDDLLDVSRIVSGKLKLQWRSLSVAKVVQAALESVSAPAERKSIRFRVSLGRAGSQVHGDATRLQQVFWNLLHNAVKFSAEHSEVTVVIEEVDGHSRVSVIDAGVGIEPHFLPQVWQRFTQEDSSNARGHSGLGLGLAIVRHLVEAHGGTVQAESAGKDKGATFSVTIPLLAEQASGPAGEAPAPGTTPPAGGRNTADIAALLGVKILVVDDDLVMRDAVMSMLSQTGAVVRGAESADEAMATLAEFRPEILLSDVAMPGEDGYSFIRRVRALGAGRGGDVPAIALTALAGEDDRQRALSAGFQVHLSKPVDLERLTQELLAQAPAAAKRSSPQSSAGR